MSEPFDMQSLFAQVMDMQQQLAEAQAATLGAEVTGRSGGGAVEIDVTGGLEFRAVRIRPDAVDPADVSMLEDLVLAALIDAMRQIGEIQSEMTAGLDLGGLGGLGGLGELGGGGQGGPELRSP